MFFQCFSYFVAEIQYLIIAAFACYAKTAVWKIDIVDIQSHAFADSNTRAQHQRNDGQIANLRFVMIAFLGFCQMFAGFDAVKQVCAFFDLQTHNGFFFLFRHIHQEGRVVFHRAFFIKIAIHTANTAQFARFCAVGVCVDNIIVWFFILRQICQITLNIHAVQIIHLF